MSTSLYEEDFYAWANDFYNNYWTMCAQLKCPTEMGPLRNRIKVSDFKLRHQDSKGWQSQPHQEHKGHDKHDALWLCADQQSRSFVTWC